MVALHDPHSIVALYRADRGERTRFTPDVNTSRARARASTNLEVLAPVVGNPAATLAAVGEEEVATDERSRRIRALLRTDPEKLQADAQRAWDQRLIPARG
jgi:hypothetical protein